MAIAVAVPAALLAACCFAVAAVLQQEAAATAPEKESLRPRLIWSLAHRPLWLTGIALSAVSFVIQGAALAFGPLVLVLPLASTDLLFALPLMAWRRRRRLTRWEVTGAACTAGGVAAFLTVLPSSASERRPDAWDWLPLLAVVASCVTVLVSAGLRTAGRVRAGAYAGAAGLLFALLDALTNSAAGLFRNHGVTALGHWEPYALLFVGAAGLLLAQSSFQAGSLAVSLPLIDTIEPIGAVLIGAAVFHERLATSGYLAVQVLGAVLAVTGIVILDRSPLVRT
ncbi:DMT family transporter [Streptomyces sp. MUM 16J]|uniref:DMT family transporter n=1 Tax=Streptomyces sp. MUM 16J TaxID=2791988 RepID=UPI001F04C628|nr:DMT family transporter [Streptomyces sp. MUM 16J]MCH0558226.1 DMT family transporter [Streptomyces sp. MUM 16J]